MRSDEELERLLEDWLDDEAPPIPREVLEGTLESISRTRQLGRRRGQGWFGRRPMGLILAAGLVVLIAVTGGLALERFGFLLTNGSGRGPSQVWDPVADWRGAPTQENPSRDRYGNPAVWSYLQSTSALHLPSMYLLMPNFEAESAWNAPGMDGTPTFLNQAWNEPALINVFVGLGTPDGAEPAIYVHPGVLTVLAWTSPVAGEVEIEGVVARPQDPCLVESGGLRFTVEQGTQALQSTDLDNGQASKFDDRATVAIGDVIYFVVDADGDARCDLTSLQLTVTLK